ncbi:MAG: 3-oxoadipyl-CoA thiolase [Pseudomonadota bacterium]
MPDAYICAYKRTPIGRFAGSLASVRPDDLLAIAMRDMLAGCPDLDAMAIDDVVIGCANQAGEDNRNVARMSLLLAGLPVSVPGATLNRLCGSGMDAVLTAARAIRVGDADLMIAGGVESMSRAPFVTAKAASAYSRQMESYDTTIGWRFVNPLLKQQYGVDPMPDTAENVAEQFGVSREDQDAFALRSQQKAAASNALTREIVPVSVSQRRADDVIVDRDEHPRPDTTLEKLAALPTPFRDGGTVTAGNASGVNDGAAALLIASERAINTHKLTPIARIVGGATAGVEPRIMGVGPVPASKRLCDRAGLNMDDFSVIELNEAFAAQGLAVLRELGVADDDARVNPHGGAIALGHPLGMSGARITGSAAMDLADGVGRYALATMCIGVGQGIAIALERT